MIIRYLLVILFFFFLTIVQGQEGDFFLHHYSPQEGEFDNINFSLVQDEHGVMYVANRSGVVRFDGKNWDFLRTASTIFSLSIDRETNTIYTAGRDGFGKIKKDNRYILSHESLSDTTLKNVDIFLSTFFKGTLYGISKDALHLLNTATGKTRHIAPPYGGSLTGLFVVDDEVLVNNTVSGLLQLRDNQLTDPEETALQGIYPSVISPSPGKDRWLIDDENSRLSLYYDKALQPVLLSEEEQNYLTENEITSGLWVS